MSGTDQRTLDYRRAGAEDTASWLTSRGVPPWVWVVWSTYFPDDNSTTRKNAIATLWTRTT